MFGFLFGLLGIGSLCLSFIPQLFSMDCHLCDDSLSALDIEYAQFPVNMLVFLIAVFCSVLYYNKYMMNIGYLAVLILFSVFCLHSLCRLFIRKNSSKGTIL